MSEVNAQQATLDIGQGPQGTFAIDANMIVTGRTCVLGSSGSGKSYAVGVLCEELCRNQIPFAVIDTEGEHTGLKEKFEAIWVGEEKGSDISWEKVDVVDLAKQAPDIAPLILDVSDSVDPRGPITAFVEALYLTLTERRTPYLLVVEEADKFVPQYGQRIPIFGEVARRGRKRGMGLMICSQRPSLVDKNVLSQCGNQLIGKLIIQNDLKSVAQFFPGKGLPKELTSLKAGQFYAMGGFASAPSLVSIKKRVTRPGGATPALSNRVVKRYLGAGTRRVDSGKSEKEEAVDKDDVTPPKGGPGLPPSIRSDDVPLIVRRERAFGIFGPKETVTGVTPVFRTLVQLGIRLRKGLLKRRFETVFTYLDGTTGKNVSVGDGLEVTTGYEKLLGLTALQVEVLRQVSPDSDTSSFDIASSLGETRGTVSRILTDLNDRRLVRSIEVNKKKLYRRLTDLPGRPSETSPLELTQVDVADAKVVAAKVKEADVKNAVKGLWDGADLESFEAFVYPLFRVELVVRRKHRQIMIDGRSGREVAF